MNNNNNNGFSPYMFGNSYGCGTDSAAGSYTYAGQTSRRDAFNVRDCMYWPASLGDASQRPRINTAAFVNGGGGTPFNQTFSRGDQFYPQASPVIGNFGTSSSDPYTFHTGATGEFGTGEPMMQQVSQAPIKAYMSTPSDGGPGGKPIQIPCHMGPGPGQIPAIPNMQPLGYKVTVPQIPPTPPVDFEIRQ